MNSTTARPLTGRMVFAIFAGCFAIIIGVNLTLAFQAVRTFPGLEVKNSYVASQSFDNNRQAQEALNWDVSAQVDGRLLHLNINRDGQPVKPKITSAVLGRATNVSQDVEPVFYHNGEAFVAPVNLGPGNWNLRLVAEAEDGTIFQQRIIVRVLK